MKAVTFLAVVSALASAVLPVTALPLADSLLQVGGQIIASNDTKAVELALQQNYSHVIVGGRTAGLALASRLSQDPLLSILVVEAGSAEPTNPGIVVPGLAGTTFETGVNWAFETVPQESAANKSVYWPRGKVLGGSSALNFMAWTRGFAGDYDSWTKLGNAGWGWKDLLPYFKKSEKFTPPQGNTQHVQPRYDPRSHGYHGPVEASFPPYITPQFTAFHNALLAQNVSVAKDLTSGEMEGVSWTQSTISTAKGEKEHRATSASAYIDPVIDKRKNLVILTGAQANKVIWSSEKAHDGRFVATGVEFVLANTTAPLTATATNEVILSAGSIQSPQLLELSGENLQDHPAVFMVQRLKEGAVTLDGLAANETFEEDSLAQWQKGNGILTEVLSTLAYLSSQTLLSPADHQTALELVHDLYGSPNVSKSQLDQQRLQIEVGSPVMELVAINVYFGKNGTSDSGVPYLSMAACNQKSFSRGSVHIASSNPTDYPLINPNYLQAPPDLFYLSRAAQYVRRLAQTPVLAEWIEEEVEPGSAVQSQAEWEEWVRENVRTEYHPIGTAAMLPREDGGVVDPNLLVYGISNLRVVDLSVVPLHVSTHPQSTAYAIAEKAADLIKAAFHRRE
ncbi:hypothetical protein JCM8097_001533 [Rhodosporidiobolus ruineniae]